MNKGLQHVELDQSDSEAMNDMRSQELAELLNCSMEESLDAFNKLLITREKRKEFIMALCAVMYQAENLTDKHFGFDLPEGLEKTDLNRVSQRVIHYVISCGVSHEVAMRKKARGN